MNKPRTRKTDNNKPRLASNGYRLPDPLPHGELLTDSTKNIWCLGESIGCGGFGELYEAKRFTDKGSDYNYVIKVDHENGPLFTEMHFYHRVAKSKDIEAWVKKKGLKFLGMPKFIGSGIHNKQSNSVGKASKSKKTATSLKYRFLVMPRFGEDLGKILSRHETFSLKTAYTIAIKIIDILEYIHSFGYIHSDIKASNLLTSHKSSSPKKGKGSLNHSEIWLVDFGLVERYIFGEDGIHKKYEEDSRRANNGTREFASRDSCIGAYSRRSDLETLAYNILYWLTRRLPWMSNLDDANYVKDCKVYYMNRINELLNFCFSETSFTPPSTEILAKRSEKNKTAKALTSIPPGIGDFLKYIKKLEFEEEPDYVQLKLILENAIVKSGNKYDELFSFKSVPSSTEKRIASPSPVLRSKRRC